MKANSVTKLNSNQIPLHVFLAAIVLPCLLGLVRGAESSPEYDMAILGGRVVDGSGSPWYRADIGIRSGKIAKIGQINAESAKQSIDATGLYVAPGFVDMMGQTATPMLRDPGTAINLLTQGITTINAGEGSSAAPGSASTTSISPPPRPRASSS